MAPNHETTSRGVVNRASAMPWLKRRLRAICGSTTGKPSDVDHDLEAAVDDALHIEGHRLRHLREARVLHDLCVHTVTMSSRLEQDPRKDHGLPRFELHDLRERNEFGMRKIVAGAFPIF